MTEDRQKAIGTQMGDLIKKEHYAAIGQVAAKWSALEAIIDMFCIRRCNISSGPRIVFTSQINGPMRKMDNLSSILELYHVDYDKKKA